MKKHRSLVDLVKLDEVLLGFIIVFFLLWHILKIFHNKKAHTKQINIQRQLTRKKHIADILTNVKDKNVR